MVDQPTTPAAEAAEPATPVGLATRARAYGALKAYRDEIDALLKQAQKLITEEQIEHFLATGSKNMVLTLPDGTRFGTMTVRENSDEPYVADGAAFLAWVDDQPALQANIETVERVKPEFEKNFLTELVTWVDDPTWEADPDGPEGQRAPLVAVYQDEIVPGLALRLAPKRPSSVATTFEQPTKAKGKVKTEANQLTGRQRILGFVADNGGIESLIDASRLLEPAPTSPVPATA